MKNIYSCAGKVFELPSSGGAMLVDYSRAMLLSSPFFDEMMNKILYEFAVMATSDCSIYVLCHQLFEVHQSNASHQ